MAKERLGAGVMGAGAPDGFKSGAIDRQSSESTGSFADVGFGVLTFSESEEFQQFAGEVFIGSLGSALGLIEPKEEGGVVDDLVEKGGPVSGGVVSEEVQLALHERGLSDFLNTGGEMAMPEEDQFLLEGVGSEDHPFQPRATEILGDLELLPTEGLQSFLSFLGREGSQGSPGLEGLTKVGRVGGGRGRIGWRKRLKAEQELHCPFGTAVGQGLDVGGSAAKTGSMQQMSCRRQVPTITGKGPKHAMIDAGRGAKVSPEQGLRERVAGGGHASCDMEEVK